MEIFTGLLQLAILALIGVIVYLIDKRVGQHLTKANDKEVNEIKADLSKLRQRLAEISVKVGLKDTIK